MGWWIDPRHPEQTSPRHPTKFEAVEGARLYLAERKGARPRRDMLRGDRVFLYETARNPRDKSWHGASSIGKGAP